MRRIKTIVFATLASLPLALPALAQTNDTVGLMAQGGAQTHNTNGPNTPVTNGYSMNSDGTTYTQPAPSGAAQPNQTTGLHGTGGNAQSGGNQ